jgi:mannitol/fructose-specific phosphotransferase system IIA component (Ntr-type)
VFIINKSNAKGRILRFLKLFDELNKCIDEDKLIKSIIAATSEESAEEILEAYQ